MRTSAAWVCSPLPSWCGRQAPAPRRPEEGALGVGCVCWGGGETRLGRTQEAPASASLTVCLWGGSPARSQRIFVQVQGPGHCGGVHRGASIYMIIHVIEAPADPSINSGTASGFVLMLGKMVQLLTAIAQRSVSMASSYAVMPAAT